MSTWGSTQCIDPILWRGHETSGLVFYKPGDGCQKERGSRHGCRIKSTLVGSLAKTPLAKAPEPRRTAVPLSMASQWRRTESVTAM